MTRKGSSQVGTANNKATKPCHHPGDVMSIHATWMPQRIARVRFLCGARALRLWSSQGFLSIGNDSRVSASYCPSTDAMSDTVARPVENSVSCGFTRKNMGGDCFLKRFSQWFWSAWMIAGSETHEALADPANRPGATNGASTSGAGTARASSTGYENDIRLPEQSENKHSHPCKACQTWGVTCDQQKPRCSHCLDQQILCFYVTPPRRSMKRSTKPRSAHLEVVNSPRLLAN
ncbi:uncharacterized protein BO80DRAFT_496739 [Aspergillus ibericus CBS 121593]|uniref:Zn(2)-C6 fungal-type domain-containing protein n=1 Tax=Aspergillus ibericus CBS 121593 TaxID=1448316 RepID=A0A395GP85_9EURO|nr:hypothetical protein BO80DRAFT_496739 [Aspergillus ibericus CBS 121593]RAK96768.1 hypothetical protein BO80DRAFT_496739 [Aspergillus ibericus CBS 121593]